MLDTEQRLDEGAWWFMSYQFQLKDQMGWGFGSTTWRGLETPWQKIKRWNSEYEERHCVLISFQLCKGVMPLFDEENIYHC